MGKQIPDSVSFNLPDGREVTIETGKLAAQADGSVVVRMGNTMLFCSVCSATSVREGQSFFPLSVDYQEKFAAAGRIPGNFFKRETRLSDYEVLICRLVDRAIRPLFPDGYMNDTQVIINLISADEDVMPDALAALAASSALAVSNIPFAGPISEVRVARIDGEYVVNPGREALDKADLEIIVGATADNVTMVEGEAKECSEADLVEAIKIGHDAIKTQVAAQLELAQKVGDKALVKREVETKEHNEELRAEISEMMKAGIAEVFHAAHDKKGRKSHYKEVYLATDEALLEKHGEEFIEENYELIGEYKDDAKKKLVRELMFETRKRLDGRDPETIRNIWTEVDYLPSAHGSAIFTRGETQSLTSLTLGTKLDEQMIDNALGLHFNKFILHYNFPGYSVGEVKPMRGPGRREVGHANLAGRSLKQVLGNISELPQTIRLVSDIMESNGSSSMATVCAGSLALMDAGIPISNAVSGIAMGMISDGERHVILSDILGDEDALGDMDFKVTGTKDGITGCQMDIKIDGLPYEMLEQALEQARAGRLHILGEMDKTIAEPREDLKPHAPRSVIIKIDKSFIGAVIGPGGKIIQEMQKETGAVINIEEVDEKGVVTITSSNKDSLEDALGRVKAIAYQPEVGDEFEAKVVTIMPYGVFAEFAPGKSGLVHISELSWTRIESMETSGIEEGDIMRVKLIGLDPKSGKFKLSRKALLEKPEGYVERPPRERRNHGGGDRRRRDNNRRRDDNRNNRD
ncbi:MAG: polyribonucleotide nucleotidyltransferase [Bacteroidota bacterium]